MTPLARIGIRDRLSDEGRASLEAELRLGGHRVGPELLFGIAGWGGAEFANNPLSL